MARSSASPIISPCRRRIQPRQRLWRIVARRAVLAAGAIERPLVFADNDRPGVMLAGAVRTYLNRFGVAPGKRAVVFADNDDAWRTAADLAAAGVTVAAIVDARTRRQPRRPSAAAMPAFRSLPARWSSRRWRQAAFPASPSATLQAEPSRSTATSSPCRAAGIRRSISPPSRRQADLGRRASRPSCRARLPPGMTVAGRAPPAASRPRRCARRRRATPARGCGGHRPAAVGFARPGRPMRDATAAAPLWRVQGAARQGLRRFPERRDHVGHQARGAGGLPLRRALSSATRRSAWRPTRARPPTSTAWRSSPR